MRFAAGCAAALFAVGLALRLTVGDIWDPFATIHYATPWPVLALLGAFTALSWLRRGHRAAAALAGALALGCVAGWYGHRIIRTTPSGMPGNCRVLFWNAEHPKHRLPEAVRLSASAKADILGIVETESTAPADAALWKAAFPGYSVETLPGFMLFITRGTVLSKERGTLAGRGRYHMIRVELDGQPVTVLFVDLQPNPLASRRPAFEALDRLVESHAGEPIILMGDFNTPGDSRHWHRMRKQLTHAFESAGNGLADTWPLPFPVLGLDHVWTSTSIRITACRQPWWWLSDHRPVIADIEL